jgi:hypothetical protein
MRTKPPGRARADRAVFLGSPVPQDGKTSATAMLMIRMEWCGGVDAETKAIAESSAALFYAEPRLVSCSLAIHSRM